MRLSTLWEMMGGRDLRFTLKTLGLMAPTHRVTWLAAASRHGVLAALAHGPLSFEALCARFVPEAASRPAFAAWLRHGCLLKASLPTGPEHPVAARGSLPYTDSGVPWS